MRLEKYIREGSSSQGPRTHFSLMDTDTSYSGSLGHECKAKVQDVGWGSCLCPGAGEGGPEGHGQGLKGE